MSISDVIWDVLGLIFLVSLFSIIFLANRKKLLMIDKDDEKD